MILGCGAGMAVLFFLYTKKIPVTYTGKATIFPLTAANESSGTSNLLKELTGTSDTKSFSQEASINIVELALSRRTREAVALEKLPQFENKYIAELLVEEENKHKTFSFVEKTVPRGDTGLRAAGGEILKTALNAKINKNGILELTFASTNEKLITPVTNVVINKISQFYIDLKIKKAREDYQFTMRKLDSINEVLGVYDRRAVDMANTTLFVPEERIEYRIPKENLITDKERVLRQKAGAANNREEALWRLQKATPIIEVLDKPEPPFTTKKTSGLLFALVGLFLGLVLGTFFCIADLIYKYVNSEISQAVFGDEDIEAEEPVNESAVKNAHAETTPANP